jgi:hypothetical protein
MPDNRTRRFRPIHIAIVAALLIAIGFIGYEWIHVAPSVVGKGPPTVPEAPATSQQQAQADAERRSREDFNDTQDAYTAQNQSREATR